jgi:hypothetical protein
MIAQVGYAIDSVQWHWQHADDRVEVLEDQTALYHNMGGKKPGPAWFRHTALTVPGTDDNMNHGPG